MSAKDVQVLRRFTQKIAAGESMLPDFSALSQYMTPEVMGAAGGAAAGGLGAMGIQKLMRSKEDEERGEGSYMPAILGALAGGAGGYAAGPALFNRFTPPSARMTPKQRVVDDVIRGGMARTAKPAPKLPAGLEQEMTARDSMGAEPGATTTLGPNAAMQEATEKPKWKPGDPMTLE